MLTVLLAEDDPYIRQMLSLYLGALLAARPASRRVVAICVCATSGRQRVHAIVPPLSLCGPVLHVRKFASVPMTPHDLLAHGTVGPRMLGFLEACVRGRANVVVSARGLFEPLGAALALAGRTGSRGKRSGQDRRYSADVG